MNRRQELVTLIQSGTPPTEIYGYFSHFLGRSSILDVFKGCGVSIAIPLTNDDITDRRRAFLQQLSISE